MTKKSVKQHFHLDDEMRVAITRIKSVMKAAVTKFMHKNDHVQTRVHRKIAISEFYLSFTIIE